MPKRNHLPKYPSYIGTPSEDKLNVQKSNPLQTLSETNMSLAEFKILDAYLSRIDSHNEEKRYVRFEKGELEKILGVERIREEDLSKRLRNLSQVVTIRDKHKERGFTDISLFEKAEAKQDNNDLWQVDLVCTPSAKEYIFNIENIGYLTYKLKDIIELTSRYSYVLYIYLDNRRKSKLSNVWEVSIDELKKKLNCTAERYEEYKHFNAEILKKCHNELEKKTSMKFKYKAIKKFGRKYTHIEFSVEPLVEIPPIPEIKEVNDDVTDGQISLDEVLDEQEKEIDYGGNLANSLGSIVLQDEFSVEQVRVIQDLVLLAIPSGEELKCIHYLLKRYHKMNAYKPKKEARFKYLCSMLENDLK
ncbi:MAG: replication initiation protein [Firmicutes bacterium]|nr:replication initiation protein [Bacillota bacterium]